MSEEKQTQAVAPALSEIAGNTSTGLLKLLALIFMLMDHAGKMLLPKVIEMRIFGRIAFPLYCWGLVVGICCTRSVPKYMLRILITGIISQPLYMIALDHTWMEPNIFLTLLIALLGLWGIREKKYFSHIWLPPLTLVLAVILNANYGWKGVLLVYLLYAVRERKAAIAALMIAFCLYWGGTSSAVSTLFGLSLRPLLDLKYVGSIVSPFFRLQALALLALPLMLIKTPNIKLPAWVSYGIYPAHLLLLWGLEQVL
ncbi:MAG: hypothetical protein IJ229_07660 [Clostridia bacterium]|nr:hypothetical protein [Clostridia bacterium]